MYLSQRENENEIAVSNVSICKTYIGSVLFRASAFTGAKLVSGVPAVIGRFGP